MALQAAMSSSYMRLGFGDEGGLDLGDRGVGGGEGVVAVAHALDGPEEIDGGGAGLGEGLADDCDFGGEGGDGRWRCSGSTPMATPMAAETPMAGAPRTIMSRMTVATCL